MNQTNQSYVIKHLEEVAIRARSGDLSLKELIQIFSTDGHYALILFLILPFLQPVPLMGLSVVFGLVISAVAIFAHLKKSPWIPEKWAHKTISQKTALTITDAAKKVFEKLQYILKKRLAIFFQGPLRVLSTGLFVFHSVLLALPLPIPFSNLVPAVAILLLALAHLEEDGLFILLAYMQTLISLAFFTLLAKGATAGAEELIHFINF